MAFEQATIKIEKVEEFNRLRQAIEYAFSPDKAAQFLRRLQRGRVRIRDFERVVTGYTLEVITGWTDFRARQLYNGLSLSDQAQIRELYLSKLESVDVALRHRFKKLYQYY
jgi:hypothetical protein